MGNNKNGTVPEEVREWIGKEKDLKVKKMELEIEKLEKKNKASQQPTVEQLHEMVSQLTSENQRLTNENQVLKERLKGSAAVADRLRDDIVWMVDKFRSTEEVDLVKMHEQRLMQQAAKRGQ